MDQHAKFEGWAVVELFGHAKEAGFVTTQYFGTACMFQVDIPEFPEREYELEAPEWGEVDGQDKLLPKGSKVRKEAIPGRTRLVGPGAVYSMNPASEEMVRSSIERGVTRRITVLSMPAASQLPAPETVESEDDEDYI